MGPSTHGVKKITILKFNVLFCHISLHYSTFLSKENQRVTGLSFKWAYTTMLQLYISSRFLETFKDSLISFVSACLSCFPGYFSSYFPDQGLLHCASMVVIRLFYKVGSEWSKRGCWLIYASLQNKTKWSLLNRRQYFIFFSLNIIRSGSIKGITNVLHLLACCYLRIPQGGDVH